MLIETTTLQPHHDAEATCAGVDCLWVPQIDLTAADPNRIVRAQARTHARESGHDVVIRETLTRDLAIVPQRVVASSWPR